MHTQMHMHTHSVSAMKILFKVNVLRMPTQKIQGMYIFCPELHATDMNVPGVKLNTELKSL